MRKIFLVSLAAGLVFAANLAFADQHSKAVNRIFDGLNKKGLSWAHVDVDDGPPFPTAKIIFSGKSSGNVEFHGPTLPGMSPVSLMDASVMTVDRVEMAHRVPRKSKLFVQLRQSEAGVTVFLEAYVNRKGRVIGMEGSWCGNSKVYRLMNLTKYVPSIRQALLTLLPRIVK